MLKARDVSYETEISSYIRHLERKKLFPFTSLRNLVTQVLQWSPLIHQYLDNQQMWVIWNIMAIFAVIVIKNQEANSIIKSYSIQLSKQAKSELQKPVLDVRFLNPYLDIQRSDLIFKHNFYFSESYYVFTIFGKQISPLWASIQLKSVTLDICF